MTHPNRAHPKSKTRSQRFTPAQRRQKFLEAANRLFLENGYADTSLNDIIRAAGGSKATLIDLFQNKAGLFGAVLETSAVSFVATLTVDPDASPQQAMQHVGESILRFYLSRSALLAYRGVIAAGPTEPAIARAFYRHGHAAIVRPIADLLQQWNGEGLIGAVDFHAEADRFTHMLRSGIYEQHLLGMMRTASALEIRVQVAAAVRVFFRGVGG